MAVELDKTEQMGGRWQAPDMRALHLSLHILKFYLKEII